MVCAQGLIVDVYVLQRTMAPPPIQVCVLFYFLVYAFVKEFHARSLETL